MIDDLNKHIRGKMRVKRGDCVPYTGWSNSVDRVGLAEIMGEAGFKRGAEIGVRKGTYSRVLCEKIPGVRLLAIDPWAPWSGGRPSQQRQDAYLEVCKQALAGFDVEYIRKTSMEAVQQVEDASLDFVYIDALHDFDNVMMDIIHWTPKVRVGGIVAGHDYVRLHNCGVMDAVHAYTFAHGIHHWYLTFEQRTRHEPYHSWFWVRG